MTPPAAITATACCPVPFDGMPLDTSDEIEADSLILRLGRHARQKVVDEMVAAIRRHDLEEAKRWDHLGQLVDARLRAGG